MRQFFYLGEAYPLGGDYGGDFAGHTYACPACGLAWGKLVLSNKGRWRIITWACAEHGHAYERGGSFLKTLSWWSEKIPLSPAQVLERCSPEFLRHEAEVRIAQILKGKP